MDILKPLIVFAVSVTVLGLAVPSRAQSSTTSLRGTIVDPKGAAISGAEVTMANPSNGFARTVETTDTGAYQFLDIPPGTYSLIVKALGFAAVRIESIRLMVDTPATIDEALKVQGGTTIVEVRDERIW